MAMSEHPSRWRLGAGRLGPWVVAGVVGWAGIAWIGWTLMRSTPSRAGFDLDLLLGGARALLSGSGPYDPTLLAGTSPKAVELFYSYPPPVAQALTVATWMPTGLALVVWAIAATAGVGLVAALLAVHVGRDPWRMAIRAVAAVPLVLPFAVAVLFGNLDAWYPLAYGALLLSALPGSSRRVQAGAGIAVVAVSIAKLQPAPLLLWVAVRAWRDRGGPQARVLAAAVVAGLVIVGVSLVAGGLRPWLDYVQVVKVASGAELVDPRNIAPVSLIGQATGIDGAALRWLQAIVLVGVVVVTLVAALRVNDAVLSVALVSAMSLMTLPVTWYHYLVALIPVGIALALMHPAARPRIVLAVVLADVAIVFLPIAWLAVAVVVVAAAESARRSPASRVPAASPVKPVEAVP